MPPAPHYVCSYTKIPVRIHPHLGITIDDLDFKISEGREGGQISLSRDATFDSRRPDIMLLAGYKPGRYHLEAYKKGTNTRLAREQFAVTDQWPNRERGPSLWFNGILPGYEAGATWGGGDNAPENINRHPAPASKKIAVLFVDTSDQRYTTNATTFAGFVTRWQQNVIDGVVSGGVTRSVKKFYKEVSYNKFDITAKVFNTPVHLDGNWGTYFGLDPNSLWRATNNFNNQCVVKASDTIANGGNNFDLTGYDMIVCVSQDVSTPTAEVAWPYGGYGVNQTTSQGQVSGRGISMPNVWGDGSATALNLDSSGRQIYETLTHEMGHTLDLPDEYTPSVAGRNIGNQTTNASWDPMDWELPWPHFCLPNRMMLGWVDPSWLSLFNFLNTGATVDQTVTLSPVELGKPPAGRFIGIEVRIGNGRNYYFEYRSGQLGEIGDKSLVPNGAVVSTDVSESPDAPAISRPDILLLAQQSDGNGAVLSNGQFYHELDNSTPTFPSDFRVDVSGIDGTKADVRIRYAVIGKPDPSIRPWPRDTAHQWQSPDIEVRNPRSQADPANWANVPWLGHDNTVVAHITNRGTLSAPGVVARFFWKDYTVGGAPENPLGSDTHDIPPGATVDFTVNWNPLASADPSAPLHYCIIVRIDSYSTPTVPPVSEPPSENNVAQSNYDRFISQTQSPGSREITGVTVGNPYTKPTHFSLRAGQSNPLYRTYMEHTWLYLEAGEARPVEIMFEFAPDAEQSDPTLRKELPKIKELYQRRPNNFSMVGLIEDPHDKSLHGPSLISGAQAQIVTGRATKFLELKADGDIVFGLIVTTNDDKGVPGGHAIVITKPKKDAPKENYETVQVQSNGMFRAKIGDKYQSLEAYYVPLPGYGDCSATL